MLKYKKLLFSLLLLVLIAVVSACGSSSDNNDNANKGDNNATSETADGEEVYKNKCLSCHGDEGQGNNGPALQGDDFAADFDKVVEQVKNGSGAMPAFENQLSEDEIDAVSKYVSEELANK